MTEFRSKRGNGQFTLAVLDDGSVDVSIESNGADPHHFDTAQSAYDYYRPSSAVDASFWNVCYHLEDFIGAKSTA